MKKYTLAALSLLLIAGAAGAQEKVVRLYFKDGTTLTRPVAEVEKILFEESSEPGPEDPNPPLNGYITQTLVEGELMYYGHDPEQSPEGSAVYFLYLKDLKGSGRSVSTSFYVNVPRQTEGLTGLPEGTYTASTSWEPMTFNNWLTPKYKSNWNVVDPSWTQYVVQEGEFTVERLDNNEYRITGRVKGGSMQDNGDYKENELGLIFDYTGPLPIEDYSEWYE